MMTPSEMREWAHNSSKHYDRCVTAEICERLDRVVELLEGMSPPLRIDFNQNLRDQELLDGL